MSCFFNNCNAQEHNVKSCYVAAKIYFRKVYRKVTYFICPSCKNLSIGTFDDFLIVHKSHLETFNDKKDVVFDIGKFLFPIIIVLLVSRFGKAELASEYYSCSSPDRRYSLQEDVIETETRGHS